MNSGKETEKNDNVFIGARVLGEDGVKLVLPTYDVLISQIKQMKSVAKDSEKQNSNISRIMKYNREHNNTIAIFGKRGTGKTSAVYTLMDYLLNQNDSNKKEKNIVLPIIEPDNFGDNTKIMGSIVGLIKNEVDEILKEVKSFKNKPESYFRNCIYVENNPLKQKMDELLEHHMYSDSEYRNIITHNYTDTATHIKKSSHLLIPDINLKHKFWDVIDEIVRLYKNELNKDELKKDVMLFIFIDDIDLKTTKCKELIEAIMQYSSHPNVITILSGDYEILEEGVMLSLIGDENLNKKGLNSDFILKDKKLDKERNVISGFTITDRKLELAENYLKKIIPPSRRHYVVDWNIDNIPEFSFGEIRLKNILYQFYNNEDNIFGYKDRNSNICSTKYPYIIFDNTPRGLINVYYSLSRIINNYKKNFFDIKSLIDTIVESSPDILKNEYNEFINWGSNFKSTQINYDLINKPKIRLFRMKYLKFVLSYFIIAEMLLYYEKCIGENEIYYSKDEYVLAKENIITSLYKKASIEDLCENRTRYIMRRIDSVYRKNLYNIAIIFALNLEFMDSLVFLNILLESEFADDYGYEFYLTEPDQKEEKDKNFIKSIYKFIKLDEKNTKKLLKEMRIYANENHNTEKKEDSEEINKFFNFLYNISKIPRDNDILKNRYKEIKDFINKKDLDIIINDDFEKRYEELEANYRVNIENIINFRNIDNIVIINTIRSICYNEEVDSIKIISNYKNKLYTLKELIKDVNSKKIDINSKKIKNIEKSNKDIVNEFLEAIKVETEFGYTIKFFEIKEELVIFKKEKLNKAKEIFLEGRDGIETRYTYIKNKTKNFFEENNDELKYSEKFKDLYIEIKDLSENNRVWYGRQEARAFLDVLNSSMSIDLENEGIKKYVPLIYYIGKFNEIINQELREDIEFEDIKEKMKKLLDDVDRESMEEVIKEDEEFGFGIEGKVVGLESKINI